MSAVKKIHAILSELNEEDIPIVIGEVISSPECAELQRQLKDKTSFIINHPTFKEVLSQRIQNELTKALIAAATTAIDDVLEPEVVVPPPTIKKRKSDDDEIPKKRRRSSSIRPIEISDDACNSEFLHYLSGHTVYCGESVKVLDHDTFVTLLSKLGLTYEMFEVYLKTGRPLVYRRGDVKGILKEICDYDVVLPNTRKSRPKDRRKRRVMTNPLRYWNHWVGDYVLAK